MKKIITALLAGLVLSSCAPSTPRSRIEQNPGKFAALGKKEQGLVRQGQISRGMSPDAVILAWGFPSRRFEGSRNAKMTRRWDYAGSRPVYTTSLYGGFGYGFGGYGPYGRRGYSSGGFGVGPDVTYVPYRLASVWFVNNRVDSWERAR